MHRYADQYIVRFPEGLRDTIKEIAARNRRSMNAEIIYHLERAYSGEAAATGGSFAGTAPVAASDKTALAGGSIHQRS